MISERDCITIEIMVSLEVIGVIAACFDSGVVKMEHQFSNLNAWLQIPERTWSID